MRLAEVLSVTPTELSWLALQLTSADAPLCEPSSGRLLLDSLWLGTWVSEESTFNLTRSLQLRQLRAVQIRTPVMATPSLTFESSAAAIGS
ncbi:hypothetical protein LINPERHAP2_LOCUS10709 [Linum perenne]